MDKSNLAKDSWGASGAGGTDMYGEGGYYGEKGYYDSNAYSKTDKAYDGGGFSSKKNYLPGKDYYDQSLYTQKQRNEQYYERNQLPGSYSHHHGSGTVADGQARSAYHDDQYYYNNAQPRNSALKNTNIESEMLAREGAYRGRRVHYEDSPRDQRYYNNTVDGYYGGHATATGATGGYSSPSATTRRFQSPSPRPHRLLPNLGYHRSRRSMSESSVLEPQRGQHSRAYNNLEHDRRYDDYDRGGSRYRASSAERDRDRYSGGGVGRRVVPPQPRRSGAAAAVGVRHLDKVAATGGGNYPPSEITEDQSLLIDDESQYNA